MTSNDKARARETCRQYASSAQRDIGQYDPGINDAIAALVNAVNLLADLSEAQDAEIDELRDQVGTEC
jgi:predicted outer membrane protein